MPMLIPLDACGPGRLGALIILVVGLFAAGGSALGAQDPPPPPDINLQAINLQAIVDQALEEAKNSAVEKSFDLNKDEVPDLQVVLKHGQGPLSTYFTTRELRVLGNTRILKGGAPLSSGETVTVADLLSPMESVTLCTVGGSLRFPERSFEEFSGGSWWGKERQGLALAILQEDKALLGYVVLSVTKLGDVAIEEVRLWPLSPAKIDVEIPTAEALGR